MKRFLTVVAATAVAAAITIPALADSGSPVDELGTFAACLRTHGIPIPADVEGVAIKQWIADHHDLAGLDAAFEACDPNPPKREMADHAAPEQLVACLRTKGLNPPAGLDELKPWILEQSKTDAGKAALTACDFAVDDKKPVEEGGPCGDAKAQSADKAHASRARKPRAQTTPTT